MLYQSASVERQLLTSLDAVSLHVCCSWGCGMLLSRIDTQTSEGFHVCAEAFGAFLEGGAQPVGRA